MSDFWVFAYGSLMWRPGFAFEDAVPALLAGSHRALCVYSVVHRGTRRHPGLVLGLDAGGACEGLAFRLGRRSVRQARMYLRAREQVTRVYQEVFRPVVLKDGAHRPVRALCFVVDRFHPQYAGRLPLAAQAHLVRRGRGISGANADYVDEPALMRLLPLVGIRNAGPSARRALAS